MSEGFLTTSGRLIKVAAQCAPIPGLAPAIEALGIIYKVVEGIKENRQALKQLMTRCMLLLEAVEVHWDKPSDRLRQLCEATCKILFQVQNDVERWNGISRLKLLFHQKEISDGIQESHEKIDDCYESFQLASGKELIRMQQEWHTEFKTNWQSDIKSLAQDVVTLNERQEKMMRIQEEHTLQFAKQNKILSEHRIKSEDMLARINSSLSRRSTQTNILEILDHSVCVRPEILTPVVKFEGWEVVKTRANPAGGRQEMNIWEGLYKDKYRVALKEIRLISSDDDRDRRIKLEKRMKREIEIWSKVRQADSRGHILPILGWGYFGSPSPCTVSPWQENGTAISYVSKQTISLTDYKKLFLGIVQGMDVLHKMDPPIAHGDVRGDNILVGDNGKPLIMDFGWSKVLEDLDSAAFTQTAAGMRSARWMAPELLDNKMALALTTASDIWSLGMTFLELLTGQMPWQKVNHPNHNRKITDTQVVILATSTNEPRARPRKPDHSETLCGYLDDALWNIIQRCWQQEPMSRPSIQEVINSLEVWEPPLALVSK